MNTKLRKIVLIYCIFFLLVFFAGQTSMASAYTRFRSCEGDFDKDVSLHGSASDIFVGIFAKMDSPALPLCEGDFDNDGDVDSLDLAVFATDLGKTDCSLCKGSGYWDGVKRDMAISPHGNIAAISAHNCYDANSCAVTLDKIRTAISDEADLIELDIIKEGNEIYINHGDSPPVVTLKEVLDKSDALKDADQLLFIEIKNDATDKVLLKLLRIINERRNWYAKDGRPVILRTFYNNIYDLKTSLPKSDIINSKEFSDIRPYIRFHVLFNSENDTGSQANQNSENDTGNQANQQKIREVALDGYDGVEFNLKDSNLFSKLTYARKLGLGINIWTIKDPFGEVFVASIREEVDAITTDYPVDSARAVVEDHNSLIYMNVWNQNPTASSAIYYRGDCTSYYTNPIGQPYTPTTEYLDIGEDRFGMSLIFDASQKKPQALRFYDADCEADKGVLITAVVNFDDLSLSSVSNTMTMSILAKSDTNTGWALELHRNGEDIELRFGVSVGEMYKYASYPVKDNLNETDSYFITAAYDGEGRVRLWIDNKDDRVETVKASGGIENNDSPVLLGAKPQGPTPEDERFFFSGRVQQIQVQSWGWHP